MMKKRIAFDLKQAKEIAGNYEKWGYRVIISHPPTLSFRKSYVITARR
ncbi:MAG: hypothetical protein LUQ42_05535 [Methanomicrobiales archaeon]|jgi:hypothetical protein|nr:hypothetical protein [Methanomicrobiales archaeon]